MMLDFEVDFEFKNRKQKNRHREGDGFRRFPTCIIMDFAPVVKWGDYCRGRCPHRPALGSPCKGGESRALPVADEARRTSGSGQNFSGFNAAAKFWAPQQVMSSVSETERLTGLRQSFRGADRVVRPYKITGHRCPHFPVSAHR